MTGLYFDLDGTLIEYDSSFTEIYDATLRELTTNQERARFIARDVRDYAEKAPAGLVLNSRTITKVITAVEGSKPHTQTVARVMDFLEKLGKDDVEQTKRRGKKLVVIKPEAADRYHDRCDRPTEQPPAESVIS